MKPIEMIPLARGCHTEFLAGWRDICVKAQKEQDRWISNLRAAGIKAAHPDDGWVDRENNTVHFSYPQFDDGCAIGDRVALGWADKYRVVTIVGKDDGPFLFRWIFSL
jgi:hypothetical protein